MPTYFATPVQESIPVVLWSRQDYTLHPPRPMKARKSESAPFQEETYDIEVSHPDHLFLLANGLIVSNSSKHSAGVVGSRADQSIGGFKTINQLLQVPETYLGGAVHSEADGMVEGVEKAPAGGSYLTVGGIRHYVPEERELKVKPGETVEAGDVLTSGLPNPALVVKHKGIGEGRRYFLDVMGKALKDTGVSTRRRNIEFLARAAVNHVELTDFHEGYLPGDILPYSLLEKRWQPRETAKETEISAAVGKYLEKPVLHHTLGTRLRPRMIQELRDYGIDKVWVNDVPLPFEPQMVRMAANLSFDPDALVRMGGSGLKRGLLRAVHRAESSNPKGTSYIAGLPFNPEFGKPGETIQSPRVTLDDPEALEDYL